MNESSTTTRKITETESGLSVWKEAQIVKDYLNSLHHRSPLPEIREPEAQLVKTEAALETETDPLKRLALVQRRMDIAKYIDARFDETVLNDLRAQFIWVAKSYSNRKGISYTAWRDIGVPASILKEANIER